MSLTPAQDEIEAQRKKDALEKCGKNMGPHDYIPVMWEEYNSKMEDAEIRKIRVVKRLLCRVCFRNVEVKSIIEKYPEIKL